MSITEFNEVTLAMYLQIRWCRGQVKAIHSKDTKRTQTLLFAIQHPGDDQWSFHDLDYDPGNQVKSEVIQAAIWQRNAIGVLECTDKGAHYYGLVYQMTGIVRGYKSTLNAAQRSYQRFAIEECGDPNNLGKRELVINERHFAPRDWQETFKKLFNKAINENF